MTIACFDCQRSAVLAIRAPETRPREYVLVDSLPCNAMGKVQHFRLKELMAERATAGGREREPDENRRTGRWQWLVRGGR